MKSIELFPRLVFNVMVRDCTSQKLRMHSTGSICMPLTRGRHELECYLARGSLNRLEELKLRLLGEWETHDSESFTIPAGIVQLSLDIIHREPSCSGLLT